MKNLNKVLAMVLVVVMAMTSVVFADFTDVTVDTDYAEAINVGAALGLFNGYEDGTFKPEGEITRAEFAAIVVRALNQEAQAASAANAASDFADVAEDHWAKGYINIVSKLGIVNGYGDGNFGPEDLVLYEQAIKMLVVALGYEPAIGTAGYPVGYLTKASEIGLNEGVKATNGAAANRGVVAQLTVNALNIPIMMQSGYGTWVEYKVQDGYDGTTHRTLLSENLGMVKLSGIVESTTKATSTLSHIKESVDVTVVNNFDTKFVADDAQLAEGNTAKVYAGETDISGYVGSKVVIYAAYDELDEELTALYVGKDTTKVEELVIAASDIENVVVDANGNITFSYWENDTDKKPEVITIKGSGTLDRVPYTPSYFENGLKDTTVNTGALLAGKLWRSSAPNFYGIVTLQLLDPTTTAWDFDTVFVENFETAVVDTNNAARYRLTSKTTSGSFSYDPEDKNLDVTLYDENGVEMDFADLVENDVFTYKSYSTASKTVVEAYKVSNTVTGAVTSIDAAEGEYTIGGEVYEANPGEISASDIVLGDEGVFYLDLLGNIVYFEATESINTNYAYILKVGTTGSIDPRTALKLYTFDGQYGTITTASKVKVDGIANIDSDDLWADGDDDNLNDNATITVTKDAAATANIVAKQGTDWFTINNNSTPADTTDDTITGVNAINPGQVITYTVNSSGYITSIDRPSTSFSLANAKGKFTEYTAADVTLEYNENSETLDIVGGSKLTLTDNTIIMVAPVLSPAKNPWDLTEDDVMLYSTANIADEQQFLNARAYNVSADKEVGFILVKTDVTDTGAGSIMAIATGVGEVNNELGETVNLIKAAQNGVLKGTGSEAGLVTVDENVTVGTFETFIPEYNAAGEVKRIVKLADATGIYTPVNPAENAGTVYMAAVNADPTSKINYYYGAVTDRVRKELTIAGQSVSLTNDTNVYVYFSGAQSKNRVTIEDYSAIDFEDSDRDGSVDAIYFGSETLTSVYAVAREYDGDIVDVVIYAIK